MSNQRKAKPEQAIVNQLYSFPVTHWGRRKLDLVVERMNGPKASAVFPALLKVEEEEEREDVSNFVREVSCNP